MGFRDSANLFIEDSVCSGRDLDIINGIEKLLDGEQTVLDVGCGDGRISKKIQQCLGLDVSAIDIYAHKKPKIPITVFDGKKIPFPDNSFDSVLFVDVLHHTKDMQPILDEALRVARDSVIIKDHFYENNFEKNVLKISDYFGNFSHRSKLPFNFKSSSGWTELLNGREVQKISWRSTLLPGIFVNQVMYRIGLSQRG